MLLPSAASSYMLAGPSTRAAARARPSTSPRRPPASPASPCSRCGGCARAGARRRPRWRQLIAQRLREPEFRSVRLWDAVTEQVRVPAPSSSSHDGSDRGGRDAAEADDQRQREHERGGRSADVRRGDWDEAVGRQRALHRTQALEHRRRARVAHSATVGAEQQHPRAKHGHREARVEDNTSCSGRESAGPSEPRRSTVAATRRVRFSPALGVWERTPSAAPGWDPTPRVARGMNHRPRRSSPARHHSGPTIIQAWLARDLRRALRDAVPPAISSRCRGEPAREQQAADEGR